VLLIRRDAKPSISAAVQSAEYKLLPALLAAASDSALHVEAVDTAHEYWFTNVNTPEDLELARGRFEDQND
jgi:molybdopterin-guanine dinucleotide biosynthesis protein A